MCKLIEVICSFFNCFFSRRNDDLQTEPISSSSAGRRPVIETGQEVSEVPQDKIIIPTKYKRLSSYSIQDEKIPTSNQQKLKENKQPQFESSKTVNVAKKKKPAAPSSFSQVLREKQNEKASSVENSFKKLDQLKTSQTLIHHSQYESKCREKKSVISLLATDNVWKLQEVRRLPTPSKGEKSENVTQRSEGFQNYSESRLCTQQHRSALPEILKSQPSLPSSSIAKQSSQIRNEKISATVKDQSVKENLRQEQADLQRLRINLLFDDHAQPALPQIRPQLPIVPQPTPQSCLREISSPLVHSLSVKPKENFQLFEKFILQENEISFYAMQSWPEILSTNEGFDFKGDPMRKIEMYSLPKNYRPILEKDLDLYNDDLTYDENNFLIEFLSKFGVPPKLKGSDEFGFTAVKETNYQRFFHDLLYIEEYESVCNISQYNMSEVEMFEKEVEPGQVIDFKKKEFKLEVPGLEEKRPNILKNDIVYVRIHKFPTVQYSGWVKDVLKGSIIIITGFQEDLVRYLAQNKSLGKQVLVDVRFTCSRYTYYLQHLAIDVVSSDTLDVLFPSTKATSYQVNDFLFYEQKPIEFVNSNIEKNSEQKKAVLNILKRSSGFAPYIIFGPPGTGKTATFVEAVLQVKLRMPDSRILVCSQNNGICDQIADKLYSSGRCGKEEILRLVASSKMEDVEEGIADITRSCTNKELESIIGYRIIVCTLITAGRIVENNDFMKKRRGYHYNMHTFTHLFIDEAGQASECQTLIPIAGLLKYYNYGDRSQLVLVGDPKQLGPCCTGMKSEKFGLGVSFLERLMGNFPIYQPDEYGQYDSRFITQLVKNYRSHEAILTISNQLFYRNKLEPQGIDDSLCYFSLNKKPTFSGWPVLFHGVKGQEIIDPKSRSIWNKEEVSTVVQYILKLFTYIIEEEDYYECVDPDEIGVIAPYFLQVQKIKQEIQKEQKKQLERLKKAKENNEMIESFIKGKIEVGSTETFQGREKRVIIVSTVRSQPDKIGGCSIGFVKDPKRFNVIMTRAQAKLIVIGNPEALKQDRYWRFLLKTCLDNKEYYGCPFSL